MTKVRGIVLPLSIAAVCMLLGAAIYESVVMAPNYARGPEGLVAARAFLVEANPGAYFRALAPATQGLLLLSVILCWRTPARWLLLGAFAAAVLTDVITFSFHYPRNQLMFVQPLTLAPADYQRIAGEWARGNYARIALLSLTATLAFAGLLREAKRS